MIYQYGRVSTKRQATSGLSIDAQIEQGRELSLRLFGRVPDEVFIDSPVSGSIEMAERPAGGDLFDVLDAGDALVVPRLDRLFRDAIDGLLSANELVLERGVIIHTGDFGELDIQNPMRKMLYTQALAMSEFERAKAVERTQTVKRQQAASDAYCGGYVPLGKEVVESNGKRVLVDSGELARYLPIMDDCYKNKGMSYRDIEQYMLQKYGYVISYKSVERKLKKYIEN